MVRKAKLTQMCFFIICLYLAPQSVWHDELKGLIFSDLKYIIIVVYNYQANENRHSMEDPF